MKDLTMDVLVGTRPDRFFPPTLPHRSPPNHAQNQAMEETQEAEASKTRGRAIHPLQDLVAYARGHSPFYRELYEHLPLKGPWSLEDLPIIDQNGFWAANSLAGNRLLTGPLADGLVFKSGGTTGAPKFSAFTRSEWHQFTLSFGRGIAAGGLRDGDRVANLFYAGEMYASFLFIMKSIELAPVPTMHFPLGGAAKHEDVIKAVKDFRIDTLAGVPTGLLSFAHFYGKNAKNIGPLPLKRILFGGEALYPDQRARLQEIFPQVAVSSIGYASVDAGLLGFVDDSCGIGEHRCFGAETILEIIDEQTGQPLHEAGRPGKLVVTNLTRLLMPIIRYPVGDRGYWIDGGECRDRKFMLLGRSEEAARIGPVSLYYEDARRILEGLGLPAFQMVIRHRDLRDELTLRIVEPPFNKPDVFTEFYKARPMFVDSVRRDRIHPLALEWVKDSELQANARTGKLIRIIDMRTS